ncbi:hypothetical protein VB735_33030 [Halotia wernerae UHCC 0503]|nr:hypothetical protein [Halotia wernerae UHCC 0503]
MSGNYFNLSRRAIDRKGGFVLIKVQQRPGTDTYEFVPIQP